MAFTTTMARKSKRVHPSAIQSLKRQLKQPRLPRLQGTPAIEGRYLVWRFSSFDSKGPFATANLTDQDRRTIWDRMAAFEKMSPSELKGAGSHHKVPLILLPPEAKKRLEELELDDLGEIWSFRVSGKRRFWCIKDENVYALLWWDPDHKVYPVGKKHT